MNRWQVELATVFQTGGNSVTQTDLNISYIYIIVKRKKTLES